MDPKATGGDLLVRNARVHPTRSRPTGFWDVTVEGGAITAITPAGQGRSPAEAVDAGGGLLSPPIVDLELIAFPQDGVLSFPEGKELMRKAMELGCDVVGGIPHYELTREDGVAEVNFAFDLAREFGRPIDLHCDETDDDQSRFLETVLARTMRD